MKITLAKVKILIFRWRGGWNGQKNSSRPLQPYVPRKIIRLRHRIKDKIIRKRTRIINFRMLSRWSKLIYKRNKRIIYNNLYLFYISSKISRMFLLDDLGLIIHTHICFTCHWVVGLLVCQWSNKLMSIHFESLSLG